MDEPTAEDEPAPPAKKTNPVLKAGVIVFVVGILVAAAAGAVQAQGGYGFREPAEIVHRCSLVVMLAGLVIVLFGIRNQQSEDWLLQHAARRTGGDIHHPALHLGCWEAKIDGMVLRMELRGDGSAIVHEDGKRREMTYQIRRDYGVVELRLEHVAVISSDYDTQRVSDYTRETRTTRQTVVTETQYTGRFLDADRLEVAPLERGIPMGDEREFPVFRRAAPGSRRPGEKVYDAAVVR